VSDEIVSRVRAWACAHDDIRAVALVGSHARGKARPDSDVDLILLCLEPERYLRSMQWTSAFGEALRSAIEDWGNVRSVRVFYRGEVEVELGLAPLDWAAVPLDAGTADVLRGGVEVLLDRDGALREALASLARKTR
jgi:predicted nucleotidyltransferase